MTQFFHDCLQSKRCLLFILIALLYSTQSQLEAQSCDPDVTPPTAICNEFLDVALDASGFATVSFPAFNSGSYDACCLADIKVRRQVDGPCDADGIADDFADDIIFCCADIGTAAIVVMRVYDCAGNFTDCTITVSVEDKTQPTCIPPANITVVCSAFDPTLEAYGTDTSTDACCMASGQTVVNNSQFNTNCNYGVITRTFKAYDCSGNSSQCTQRIEVTLEQNYFVKFPNDIIQTTMNPNSQYGEPTFFHEDCELIGVSYSDQVFIDNPDNTLRLERTWSIINWCTYDPQLPTITVPNPNPNAIADHPSNLPGPVVSNISLIGDPWKSTIVKINPSDPLPTDYSTFWDANANRYDYLQIIRIVDTFFVAVQGTVFADTLTNCAYDAGESKLSSWTVRATGLVTGNTKEVQTDQDGKFTVFMDGFDTVVNITLVSSGNFGQNCQTSYDVPCVLGTSVDQDIPVHLEERCALLSVGIGSPRLRRCFENRYHVEACNLSGETVANAYVEVELDAYLVYNESSVPGTLVAGNLYRFDLGDLIAGDCQSFWIDFNVSCDAPIGATHCTEARIYPYDDCRDNTNWSGADVDVTAVCDVDSVKLKIKNIGDGAMTQVLGFVVTEDIIMLQDGNFQLGVDEEINLSYPANGSTWRLEAEEEPLHPFGGVQAVALEGCGGVNQTGLVNLFPLSDSNPFIGTDCQENIGAFDPNDKQAFPKGFGTQHDLKANVDIEYMIRFQNTGTDTAFTVKVLDTLAQYLVPSSVRVLSASHPMEFAILEGGVLQFLFNNIMLPDSNVNAPGSNGFLKLRVAQQADNPEGTRIENVAAIYFDFNEPIFTNTTYHTINNHFLTVGIDDPLAGGNRVKVFPNPAADMATFQFEQAISNGWFELKNQIGQSVRNARISGVQYQFQRGGLQPGIYFFTILQENGALFSGKILIK